MPALPIAIREHPVKLTLDEESMVKAKGVTNHFPVRMLALLVEFVAEEQGQHHGHRLAADACADDWNSFHASVGSFADEYSTL